MFQKKKKKKSWLVSDLVSYSEGELVKSDEAFRNGAYPDVTLLTEPVDEILLLGIPVEGEVKGFFYVLIE